MSFGSRFILGSYHTVNFDYRHQIPHSTLIVFNNFYLFQIFFCAANGSAVSSARFSLFETFVVLTDLHFRMEISKTHRYRYWTNLAKTSVCNIFERARYLSNWFYL